MTALHDPSFRAGLEMAAKVVEADRIETPEYAWDDGDYAHQSACGRHAATIRALSPPADHVLVPLVPTEPMWGNKLVRYIVIWMSGEFIMPKHLFALLKYGDITPPDWLVNEPEMKTPDHTVSNGTRAVILYRAMIKGE